MSVEFPKKPSAPPLAHATPPTTSKTVRTRSEERKEAATDSQDEMRPQAKAPNAPAQAPRPRLHAPTHSAKGHVSVRPPDFGEDVDAALDPAGYLSQIPDGAWVAEREQAASNMMTNFLTQLPELLKG